MNVCIVSFIMCVQMVDWMEERRADKSAELELHGKIAANLVDSQKKTFLHLESKLLIRL